MPPRRPSGGYQLPPSPTAAAAAAPAMQQTKPMMPRPPSASRASSSSLAGGGGGSSALAAAVSSMSVSSSAASASASQPPRRVSESAQFSPYAPLPSASASQLGIQAPPEARYSLPQYQQPYQPAQPPTPASSIAERMRAVTEQSSGGCFTLTAADDATYISALKSDVFQLQMTLDRLGGGGGGPSSPKAGGMASSRGASRLRAEISSIKQVCARNSRQSHTAVQIVFENPYLNSCIIRRAGFERHGGVVARRRHSRARHG